MAIVISVIGPPAIGKTLLCKRIEELGGYVFVEESAGLPERIIHNINNSENSLQSQLWFHDQMVRNILRAVELKKMGKSVVMDTFWGSLEIYTEVECRDDFDRDLLLNISRYDSLLLPSPDLIVGLTCSDSRLHKLFRKRSAAYEQSKKAFMRIVQLRDGHNKYYEENAHIEVVNVDNFDFHRDPEVLEILEKVKTAERAFSRKK